MSETFEMVAKTLYGLEEILAGELDRKSTRLNSSH